MGDNKENNGFSAEDLMAADPAPAMPAPVVVINSDNEDDNQHELTREELIQKKKSLSSTINQLKMVKTCFATAGNEARVAELARAIDQHTKQMKAIVIPAWQSILSSTCSSDDEEEEEEEEELEMPAMPSQGLILEMIPTFGFTFGRWGGCYFCSNNKHSSYSLNCLKNSWFIAVRNKLHDMVQDEETRDKMATDFVAKCKEESLRDTSTEEVVRQLNAFAVRTIPDDDKFVVNWGCFSCGMSQTELKSACGGKQHRGFGNCVILSLITCIYLEMNKKEGPRWCRTNNKRSLPTKPTPVVQKKRKRLAAGAKEPKWIKDYTKTVSNLYDDNCTEVVLHVRDDANQGTKWGVTPEGRVITPEGENLKIHEAITQLASKIIGEVVPFGLESATQYVPLFCLTAFFDNEDDNVYSQKVCSLTGSDIKSSEEESTSDFSESEQVQEELDSISEVSQDDSQVETVLIESPRKLKKSRGEEIVKDVQDDLDSASSSGSFFVNLFNQQQPVVDEDVADMKSVVQLGYEEAMMKRQVEAMEEANSIRREDQELRKQELEVRKQELQVRQQELELRREQLQMQQHYGFGATSPQTVVNEVTYTMKQRIPDMRWNPFGCPVNKLFAPPSFLQRGGSEAEVEGMD